MLLVSSDLFRYLRPVLLRNSGNVHLISEGTRHGHKRAGLDRGRSSDGVIRAVAHVGTDRRQRIDECRTLLNQKALHGIGIVRAPDLRAVIQHSRIKSRPTARAGLQQNIRKSGYEAFQKFVEPEHIAVAEFPPAIRRKRLTSEIRQRPVHIPFHIGNGSFGQDLFEAAPDIFAHIGSGIIQNILIPGKSRFASADRNRPVRMRPVEIGIRRDHLRLHPDPEPHAQFPDIVSQCSEPAG